MRRETHQVRPYQIIVWVSLNIPEMLEWDSRTPQLPAILDTGHNHNFSIGRSHLIRWAGLQPEVFEQQGTLRERGLRVPLHAAKLWLHPNVPGEQQASDQRISVAVPHPLDMKGGIAIYPDEVAPRLPVLGLRGLTNNHLHLIVDGHRQRVWLRTLDWRLKLLQFLT